MFASVYHVSATYASIICTCTRSTPSDLEHIMNVVYWQLVDSTMYSSFISFLSRELRDLFTNPDFLLSDVNHFTTLITTRIYSQCEQSNYTLVYTIPFAIKNDPRIRTKLLNYIGAVNTYISLTACASLKRNGKYGSLHLPTICKFNRKPKYAIEMKFCILLCIPTSICISNHFKYTRITN